MSDALRFYLIVGLIAHKAVWEVLKRAHGAPSGEPRVLPLQTKLVKLAKVAILAGVVLQTLMPEGWLVPVLTERSGRIQIVGVVLFTLGNLLAIAARVQLGTNWSDIESARVLNHQAVVARGIYGRIRHPIYVGDLLLLLGLELSLNSSAVYAVVLLVPIVLRQAIREEQELRRTLAGYDDYCRATRRFIPYLV